MGRISRAMAAWCVGWMVDMVAMALWSYDGLTSLLFQPIVAAIIASLGLGIVLLVGLVLRVRGIGRLWDATPSIAAGLAGASLAVMAFGSSVGLTGLFTDPDTGRSFSALHPAAALLSYVSLLFAVAHWPARTVAGRPA
ncbi:hypothetical protein TA3x_002252 [Tundrisphaera sp. TA3]|uniref:hypothetical protein n=1 Tax=Tundrisphaera sp. TA3 TaxID=3435775 RepID=UPI003EB9B2E0